MKNQTKREVAALLAGVSLADLARTRGIELKPRGDRLWGLCPFHAEKTPSFAIRHKDGRDRFVCFGCRAQGDAIVFLRRLDGLTFRAAVKVAVAQSRRKAA